MILRNKGDNGSITLRFEGDGARYFGVDNGDLKRSARIVRDVMSAEESEEGVCVFVFDPEHMRVGVSKTKGSTSIRIIDSEGRVLMSTPCDPRELLGLIEDEVGIELRFLQDGVD